MSTTSGSTRYFIALFASTFLMGSSFVSAKILLGAGVPPVLLAGWRFVVAAAATLPLAILLEGRSINVLAPRRMAVSSWATVLMIGLLQTTAVMGFGLSAMRWISAHENLGEEPRGQTTIIHTVAIGGMVLLAGYA